MEFNEVPYPPLLRTPQKTADNLRRFRIQAWGHEIDVDMFLWIWAGESNKESMGELGFEALRLNKRDEIECFISGYNGAIVYDYNPDITLAQFQEKIEKIKNIEKNMFKPPKPVVEDMYHG